MAKKQPGSYPGGEFLISSTKNYILYLYLFCKKFNGSNPRSPILIRFESDKILYNTSRQKL